MIDLPVPELPRTPLVERTRDRYADVHRLLERKWTISAIARHLGLDRKTVRRFKTTPLDELLASAVDFGIHKAKLLEPFKPYLNSRFTAGYTSGPRLFHEIRERGYTGSKQVVRRHLAKLRKGTAEPVRADIPSPRRITSWIMRPRETLTDRELEKLIDVRIACPDIARACDLARCFRDLLVNRWRHAAGVDPPGRTGRSRPGPLVRRLPPPGPRRRHRRPHPRMELRQGRRQRKPSLVPTSANQDPHPGMIPGSSIRPSRGAPPDHR